MHVKHSEVSVAETYGVKDRYTRFNQKYNLNIQALWQQEIMELDKLRKENLKKYVLQNEKGYSMLDLAFLTGANRFIEQIDYGINLCDQQANTWNNVLDKDEAKCKVDDPVMLTRAVKKAARMYGATIVGIAPAERKWFYSHWYDQNKKESYPLKFSDEDSCYENITRPTLLKDGTRVIPHTMKYVIVCLFEMEYEYLRFAPTLLSYGDSIKVYANMSMVTMNLAGFINCLGYQAIPSLNCTALNIPLAIEAGLGQIGHNGKLINPQLGPRSRIAKVITDMPLIPDKPILFGVTEFCSACRKCVRECPADAISDGSMDYMPVDEAGNGHYLHWAVDHKKCYRYWTECGTNCNICLYVCSYNRGYKWTDSIIRTDKENYVLINSLLTGLDDSLCTDVVYTNNKGFWHKE